jgi:hypothetical protein
MGKRALARAQFPIKCALGGETRWIVPTCDGDGGEYLSKRDVHE